MKRPNDAHRPSSSLFDAFRLQPIAQPHNEDLLIVDAVDEHLTYQAERESKRKKVIRPGEQLPFEHAEPVWQLRVGEFRVLYDVSKQRIGQEVDEPRQHEGVVTIRAVRRKPRHKTTRKIL